MKADAAQKMGRPHHEWQPAPPHPRNCLRFSQNARQWTMWLVMQQCCVRQSLRRHGKELLG